MTGLNRKNGLTLVEMLVVLGVIMVLGGFVVVLTRRVDNQSKENAVANAFTLLGGALREYYEFRGAFPLQADRNPANALAHVELMVQELRSVPASRQVLEKLSPALVKSVAGVADVPELCDPWGTVLDYTYARNETFPELLSAGPDKRFGTADDISSKGKR